MFPLVLLCLAQCLTHGGCVMSMLGTLGIAHSARGHVPFGGDPGSDRV